MRTRKPYVTSMYYAPLDAVDVPRVIRATTVRAERKKDLNISGDYDEVSADNIQQSESIIELALHDVSVPGYIGVPRAYGFRRLRLPNVEVRLPYAQVAFPLLKLPVPRDNAQREFWYALRDAVQHGGAVDVTANAKTGTGKTMALLWLFCAVVRGPVLVTVPTNYLRRQWYRAIVKVFGTAFAERYVGHVQQNKCDYRGRLITLALAPSLARRDYGPAFRSYHKAVFFDELHTIGTPDSSVVLSKCPQLIRVGLTATNRTDAFRKVSDLHLGPPAVVSRQEVLHPKAYIVTREWHLPRGMSLSSEYHLTTFLAQNKQRTQECVDAIYRLGWLRGRVLVGLSDRTNQLIAIRNELIRRGVPAEKVGLLVAQYSTGKWRTTRTGNRVKETVKVTPKQQEWITENCDIILATYGLFSTGSDVPRVDTGIELTPRAKLVQSIGRVVRLGAPNKVAEWYSIKDRVYYSETPEYSLFSDPLKQHVEVQELIDMHEGRVHSLVEQKADIRSYTSWDDLYADKKVR